MSSKILMTLDGLADLLFPKHDIRITNACISENNELVLEIDGKDVPDSEWSYLEYVAVYGTQLDSSYTGDLSTVVREVRLNKISSQRL